MAVVAKVDKEAKNLQRLQKIYSKARSSKVEPKAKSEVTPVEKEVKKFTRKELLRDILIMLLVAGIAFSGYAVARFVNF